MYNKEVFIHHVTQPYNLAEFHCTTPRLRFVLCRMHNIVTFKLLLIKDLLQ